MEKRLEELETEVNRFKTDIESLKTERKERSAALQQKLFGQFRMLNAKGEVKDLCTIFEQTVQKVPPGGAGECALPKLLQYAYLHQLKPLAMAEFWWGDSPKTKSGVMDITILPVKGSASRFYNICYRDWR